MGSGEEQGGGINFPVKIRMASGNQEAECTQFKPRNKVRLLYYIVHKMTEHQHCMTADYRYTSYLVHSLRACMTLARARVAMRPLHWPVGPRWVRPSVSRHWRLDHWTGPGGVGERARTFGRARQLWLDNKRRRRRQRFRRCRAHGMHEKRYIPTRGTGERERGREEGEAGSASRS